MINPGKTVYTPATRLKDEADCNINVILTFHCAFVTIYLTPNTSIETDEAVYLTDSVLVSLN